MAGIAGVIQMVALALPAVGMTYGIGRGGTRITTGLWRRTKEQPLKRAAAALAVAGAVGALAFVWWPDGDYVPIQPGERWTAPELAASTIEATEGRRPFEAAVASASERSTAFPDGDSAVTDEGGGSVVESPSPTTSPAEEPTESPSPTTSPTATVSPSPTTETSPS